MKNKILAILKQKQHRHDTISDVYVYDASSLLKLAETLSALLDAELAKRTTTDWAKVDPDKWGGLKNE